jgi:gas vesicle protein
VAQTSENRSRRFLIAVVIGGVCGAVVGLAVKPFLLTDRDGDPARDGTSSVPEVIESSVAWQYARAYQENNWEQVIAMTPWMEERLEYVARSDGPEAVSEAREALFEQLGNRNLADNYLRDAGVEDQFLFTPGARLDYVTDDTGRDDLEAPVVRRTWIRVTYPSREKALLDRDGIPIRSLRVGVNVSEDGKVLKAGVSGNVDIDWNSIEYDWPSR